MTEVRDDAPSLRESPTLALFDRAKVIRDIADDLGSLGRAFRRTGNPGAGSELAEISDALHVEAQAISEAAGNICAQRSRESDEATRSVIMAALGGLTLGNRKDGSSQQTITDHAQ